MKASQTFGMILAVALIIFGVAYPVPEKQVYVSSSSKAYYYSWSENIGAKYLGGDAYNYQVEAALKAGYMSGVLAMKSITFVGGLLLLFLTLYSRLKCAAIEEQNSKLFDIANLIPKYGKTLEKVSDCADKQDEILNAVPGTLDKHFSPNEESNVEEETV